jgi:hypothetical protein
MLGSGEGLLLKVADQFVAQNHENRYPDVQVVQVLLIKLKHTDHSAPATVKFMDVLFVLTIFSLFLRFN